MSHASCVKHGRRASVHNGAIMHRDATRCDGTEIRWYAGGEPDPVPFQAPPMTPEERLLHAIFGRFVAPVPADERTP